MSQPRYSRQLAGRVEVEFHRHPNRFRRWTWWTALGCVIAAGVWLVQAGTRGDHRIYEAGAVATPHAMFENDCKLCHIDNLAPLKRLTTFNDNIHSVSNEKCIYCHMGTLHHENQVPMHGDGPNELSCAKCHREHKGDEELARVADRHCTACHANLETAPGSPTFDQHVVSFEDPDGHPDFKIEELLRLDHDQVEIAKGPDGEPIHHAFRVLGFEERPGEAPRWQDKARIRFNHEAHLKAMFDEEGRRIKGERQDEIRRRGGEKNGEYIGYPTSCMDCHEFDVERRYMKPISYEKHCKECHPLTFDVEKFTEETDPDTGTTKKVPVTVPHDTPAVVRGYLSKVYTLDPLNGKGNDQKPAEDDPLAELRRGFPGRDFEASFNAEQARKIRALLDDQEKDLYPLDFVQNELARRDGQQVLFKENGACALCHDIEQSEGKAKEPWAIVPPNIPQRWYKHSWFRHDSHRMLSCVECHHDLTSGRPVYESASTGDVLMPTRASCVECHRSGSAEKAGAGDTHLLGARVDCVECHGYHDYSKEDFDGNLKLDLTSRPDHSPSTPHGHGSK